MAFSDEPSRVTNSAQRLFDLLKRLKAIRGIEVIGSNTFTKRGFEVLTAEFGATRMLNDADDPWSYMEALRVLHRMFDDVRREVAEAGMSEDEQKFYSRPLAPLLEALSPLTLNVAWQEIRDRISPEALTGLEGTAMILRRSVMEVTVAYDELDEIRKSIDELMIRLKNSSIESRICDFLLANLLRLKSSIDEYRFRGINGFQESFAGYLGSLQMSRVSIAEIPEVEKSDLLHSVVKLAGKGEAVMKAAHSVAWMWPYLRHAADELRKYL